MLKKKVKADKAQPGEPCSILQKRDNAEAAAVQNRPMFNTMKTRYMKTDWLIPLLGIAVVAGSLMAVTTYVDLEQKVQAQEALTVTLDRLYQDQKLSAVLRLIHDGETEVAAQRLDLLLCGSILRLNSELASADGRTRAYVQDAFRKIALLRPGFGAGAGAGSAPERSEDQVAAETILRLALGSPQTAQAK